MSVVACESVAFGFEKGKSLFENINFSVNAGDFYYLTGKSGSGKSTLIRLIIGALKPTKGTIKVFGRDFSVFHPEEMALMRQKIGIVFQDFYLLDHLTLQQNVAIPLRLRGYSWKESLLRSVEALKGVGLEKMASEYPCSVSGGEKQRVVIARCLVVEPQLILTDEPTGNLDDENAHRLMELFMSLNKKGTSIVFATHNRQLIKMFPKPQLVTIDGSVKVFQPFAYSPFTSSEVPYGIYAS